MIFDFIFFRIYKTKFPDTIYAANTVLILLQSLILSSFLKMLIGQLLGNDYLSELMRGGTMRLVYLAPIIPCGVFNYFRYSKKRINSLELKWNHCSKSELNIRLFFTILLLLVLFFLPAILGGIFN